MKNVLSRAGLEELARVARGDVLVGLDFDGTLAPIVEDPGDARIGAQTRAFLLEVAERYPVAVVSGRARADVLRRLDGIPVTRIVGNHGAETAAGEAPWRRSLERWRELLTIAFGGMRGVRLEDKGWSLSIHYRAAAARGRVARLAASLGEELGARVVPGKEVVNLTHPDAPDKGKALARVIRELRSDAALYVGDDHTDESAFAAAAMAIRVGRSRSSAARWFVEEQPDVDALLSALSELRHRPALRSRG